MLSKRISVLLPTLLVCICALFLCACGEQERQAPDLSRSNIVVVNRTITVNGFEEALYSKDGGATWQEENVFSELVYGSTYSVCVKYKETDDFKESPASNVVEVQIIKTPAETPVLRSDNFIVNGNRVEIVGFENAQYSADNGETWSTSNIFANLNFGQSYNFKVRIMETADTGASAVSRAYTVAIDKTTQDAPLLLSERVVMNENVMNIIVNNYGGNVLYSKDGGLTSQTSNVFTNLTSGSTYAICIKYAETDTAQESPWSNVVYRTFDKQTQATPMLTYANFVQDGKNLTITGFEDKSAIFSIDNGENWSEVGANVFENLTIGQTYIVRVQFTDTATHNASEISAAYMFTMQKIAQTAPIITIDNIEQNGQIVTINGFENAEYSLDGVKWQDSNVFENLNYDATYKFYVRYKGNDEYLPSAEANVSYKIIEPEVTEPTDPEAEQTE